MKKKIVASYLNVKERDKKWLTVAAAALVLVTYYLVVIYFRGISLNDPDRFYHLALARQTSVSGIVRSLPQAEDISWSKDFPDKNFLFTWLTAVAYHFGGETSALFLVYILAIIFLAVCGLLFARYLPVGFWALLLISFFWVPDFANRLTLFRPHLLALICVMMLVGGLIRRHPLMAALGGCLFVLSYHALYIAAVILTVAVVTGWSEGRVVKRTILMAFAGVIVGILINPYFPKNLTMASTTMSIAMNWDGLKDIDRPLENVALPMKEFFVEYGPFLIFVFVGALVLWKRIRVWDGKISYELTFTLILAVIFWFLSTITRRASEYAIPFTGLFAAVLIGTEGTRTRQTSLVALLLILQAPLAIMFYSQSKQPADLELFALEAIKEIPKDAGGEKIFNCEWHNSPYLLYSRPDLRFVDISDPALLFKASPRLYELRKRLREGKIADLYSVIADDFKSNFVLCEKRLVIRQMEQDSRFKRIYPKELVPSDFAVWKPFLYQLAKTPGHYEGSLR